HLSEKIAICPAAGSVTPNGSASECPLLCSAISRPLTELHRRSTRRQLPSAARSRKVLKTGRHSHAEERIAFHHPLIGFRGAFQRHGFDHRPDVGESAKSHG